MLRAEGAHENENMAHAMHKLTVVVHEVVPRVGPLEAKNARGSSHSWFFERCMERKKKTNRGEQESDRSEQSEECKKLYFDEKWEGGNLQKCASCVGVEHSFRKSSKK